MEEISRFVKNKSQLISERHVSPVTRVAKLKHLKERFKQHKLELNQVKFFFFLIRITDFE